MSDDLPLPVTAILLRLGVAALLGALVGLARDRLEHAASLRTHALVALAAALLALVSAFGTADTLAAGRATAHDPSRVASQVVVAVGILGAAFILRRNPSRGLTTAASVWAVAGVGLAAGGGLFLMAGIATALILLIDTGLRPLERRLATPQRDHRLVLRVRRGAGGLAAVEGAVAVAAVELRGLRLRPARGGTEDRVELDLGASRQEAVTALLEALGAQSGVWVVSYRRGGVLLVAATPAGRGTGGHRQHSA